MKEQLLERLLNGESLTLSEYDKIKDYVTDVTMGNGWVNLNKKQKYFYSKHQPFKK